MGDHYSKKLGLINIVLFLDYLSPSALSAVTGIYPLMMTQLDYRHQNVSSDETIQFPVGSANANMSLAVYMYVEKVLQ